ncbi:hypothetical protein BHQ21_19050 [Mycobacterium sherrisii]|uniref:Uncharacterized protein n=1 Tax=Mycobacterium sherrisii TaxID=243061 RepID=A0A1E3SPL5_9MYCO|nr:hypothetical protein BHQ21_19050 [Mycobacterium sherrisii]
MAGSAAGFDRRMRLLAESPGTISKRRLLPVAAGGPASAWGTPPPRSARHLWRDCTRLIIGDDLA